MPSIVKKVMRHRIAGLAAAFPDTTTVKTITVNYAWPSDGHIFLTTQFGEGSACGFEIVHFDGDTGTITIRRVSFWKRLRAYLPVLIGNYRILRQKHGRLTSFHQADTLAMQLLR